MERRIHSNSGLALVSVQLDPCWSTSRGHTSLMDRKIEFFMIFGLLTRKTILDRARATKMEDGTMERKIFSNLRVKSKSSRHPWTLGPRESSFRHPENSMSNMREETFAS